MAESAPALTSNDATRWPVIVPGEGSRRDPVAGPEFDRPPALDGVAAARVAAAVGWSRADSTKRAYASDWARFTGWCSQRGCGPLPAAPEIVASYLAEAAGARDEVGERVFAPSTLARWIAAINAAHRSAGHTPPGGHEVVRATLAGIRRLYAEAGERPVRRRAPLLLADVRHIVDVARSEAGSWVQQVAERRDSALILMGFAGAFRRSELVRLSTTDIQHHAADGLHVRLGRSKTDQEGQGAVKALPYGRAHQTCPVCAYLRWRGVLDAWETQGRVGVLRALREHRLFEDHLCRNADWTDPLPGAAVFRGIHKTGAIGPTRLSGQAINPMLHRRAAAAGIDPQVLQVLGGHSLRVGFVTQAARAGADTAAIMRQTGHTTDAMVRLYTREAAPLVGNAVTELGL